jgi:neutral ceramidase
MIPPALTLQAALLALAVGVGTVQAAQPAPAAGSRVLKAGAATSNITPPLGLGIVGGWDAPPATHIHDELHVRCLAQDDGTNRVEVEASRKITARLLELFGQIVPR